MESASISHDDFAKMDLRVGRILTVTKVEKSRNLLKLSVDVGESTPRQILTGIAEWYSAEDLIGKLIIVLANLKPKIIMGLESKGMLLAADVEGKAFLIKLDEKRLDKVKPGMKIT